MDYKFQAIETVNMEDMRNVRNRVKFCYAFLTSPLFFHQEIGVFNPCPKKRRVRTVLPADTYLFEYHADKDLELPSLEELAEITVEADAPVVCMGSHIKEEDRTIQMLCLPDSILRDENFPMTNAMLVKFVSQRSEPDSVKLLSMLKEAYWSFER